MDSPLTKLILSADIGLSNDLNVICQALDISIKAGKLQNDLCLIRQENDSSIVIYLDPTLDKQSKFTFVAIAIAEMLISPERIKGRGIYYDVFFKKEIHNLRSTKAMILATRIAFPEGIIDQIVIANNMRFEARSLREKNNYMDVDAFISESNYLPEFIRSVIKGNSVRMLLNNKEFISQQILELAK